MKNNEYLLIFYQNGLYAIDINGKLIELKMRNLDFINQYCLANGSTLEGRNEAFRYLTNIRYKPCLIVSNIKGLFYLCTRRIENEKDFCLINYLELDHYKQVSPFITKLYFKSGLEFSLDINYRIIKRQIKLMQLYLRKMSFNVFKCYNFRHE